MAAFMRYARMKAADQKVFQKQITKKQSKKNDKTINKNKYI